MEVIVHGKTVQVPKEQESLAATATGFDLDGNGKLVFIRTQTEVEQEMIIAAKLEQMAAQVKAVASKCPEVLDLMIALNLLPEQAKNL